MNSGSLQNTYNYLVPAAGTTRGYRVTREFKAGEIEYCDFRNMALDGLSFVPTGVLIDNTRGIDDCVVTILEYSWRIVIPAGQFAHMPYPAPYNQTATIEGNAPELTVIFVDYPVIPFLQNSNSGGGAVGGIQDITAGTGINIDKTDPANPVISATGGGGGGGGAQFETISVYLDTVGTGEQVFSGGSVVHGNNLWANNEIVIPQDAVFCEVFLQLQTMAGTVYDNAEIWLGDGAYLFTTQMSGLANSAMTSNYYIVYDTLFSSLKNALGGVFNPKLVMGGGASGSYGAVTLTVRFHK